MKCGTNTLYKRLTCKLAVCNKSGKCSVFAPETVKGWKAGYSVGNFINCNDNLVVKDDEDGFSLEKATCGPSREDVFARKVSPKGNVATSIRKYL